MDYEHFMKSALAEAEKAFAAGEFPVGCVLVNDQRIIASGSRIGTAGAGKNETLVGPELLTPAEASSALAIDAFAFSEDQGMLLLYANSKRVWRQNTRGDYWLLDRSSRQLTARACASRPSSSASVTAVGPIAASPAGVSSWTVIERKKSLTPRLG